MRNKSTFLLGILLSSIAITLALFYIDEGRYSLSGFFDDSGNPFAFLLYCSLFFLLQWLMGRYLLPRYVGLKKVLFAFMATIVLLLVLLLAMLLGTMG